jgi:hypothetical protein
LMARNEPLSPNDDEMPVSRAFKFFMNIQLTLIMFLALCWLYDHVWSGTTFKYTNTYWRFFIHYSTC